MHVIFWWLFFENLGKQKKAKITRVIFAFFEQNYPKNQPIIDRSVA
jgi:hypothetical protein